MIYDFAITVPAGTTEASPLVSKLKLTKGIIHKFECEFPNGCAYTVFARVKRGLHQVWPVNPDGVLCSDGHVISFEEYLEVSARANEFQVVTYSPNANYDHVLRFRIGIIESDTALFVLKVLKGLQNFLKLVGVKL
jgi:hypothetical protein